MILFIKIMLKTNNSAEIWHKAIRIIEMKKEKYCQMRQGKNTGWEVAGIKLTDDFQPQLLTEEREKCWGRWEAPGKYLRAHEGMVGTLWWIVSDKHSIFFLCFPVFRARMVSFYSMCLLVPKLSDHGVDNRVKLV